MSWTTRSVLEEAARRGEKASARLVDDWVKKGLLDRRIDRRRGAGHARGSDAPWPDSQAELFFLLLKKRHEVKTMGPLYNVPIAIWMYFGDAYVPLRQVRVAMDSWIRVYKQTNLRRAKESAAAVLASLDIPRSQREGRAKLRKAISDAALRGEPDYPKIDDALRELAGTSRREVPPGWLDVVESFRRGQRARAAAVAGMDNAPDELFRASRDIVRQSRADYAAGHVPIPAQGPALPIDAGLSARLNNACSDLLHTLGFLLLAPDLSNPDP